MTRTEIIIVREKIHVSPPTKYHTPPATKAKVIMIGTNTPDILSANFAIGALELWASSTSFIIWDKVVSSPTLVTFILKTPVLFRLAPTTLLSTLFSTGRLSPVNIDSSTDEYPSITTPSKGIFSPGRTNNTSPTTISSTFTTDSTPSLIMFAVFGARFISLLIASVVRPFDTASKYLPKVIKVSITAADS